MSSFFLFLAKIFCRREVRIMAVVYATLIVKGKKTLEDVPALLKEQVREILSALDVQVQKLGNPRHWKANKTGRLYAAL